MAKLKKIKKERKSFRREYIPLFFSIVILCGLIVGLVVILNKKPDVEPVEQTKNTLSVQDIDVGGVNDYCEGYNIDEYRDKAKKVYLSYEEIEKIYAGKTENIDMPPDDPDYWMDYYVSGLKINVLGASPGLRIKIILNYNRVNSMKENKSYEYFVYEGETEDMTFTETVLLEQTPVTVRIYLNDAGCPNLLLREFTLTLPRYNTLYDYELCHMEKFRSDPQCAMYVFNDNSYNDDLKILEKFSRKLNSENNQENDEEKTNKLDIKNIVIIVAGIVLVVGVVIIVAKGRRKHEE